MSYVTIPSLKSEIAPDTLLGLQPFPLQWKDYEWMSELPKNTFFSLWLRNPSEIDPSLDLPLDKDLYVVSFHYERVDPDWIMKQAKRISQPIIIINDGSGYDFPWPNNVYFFNFFSWHIHLEQIMAWFPEKKSRNIKYKISAVCHRITQSKLLVTTALLENINREDLLLKLGSWLEEKNVHHRSQTGIKRLDNLSRLFFEKYYGTTIEIDDFDEYTHNVQRINSTPWQPLYLDAAIHVTNESYHYSYMMNELGSYIRPGPLLSEKTFKCLLAETPFISVGQFDVYNQLKALGLKFDYGDINLAWDSDPRNFSRLEGIIDTVIDLGRMSKEHIHEVTKESSQHNADLIWSGEFSKKCRAHNEKISQEILERFA